MLISHKENLTNAFDAQHTIFAFYAIEDNMINGKAHYSSNDGTKGIWYGECGLWMIGSPDGR